MKKYWITNLRVFATLTVVLLHAASFGIIQVGKISLNDWWICHVINIFGRFAVPVFVMLSGYLLLGKYEDLNTFLSKRFSRVFIPFLIWSLIYMIYANFSVFPSEKTAWEIGAFAKRLLIGGGGGSGHFWFVYMLLGLYFFTPIISRWIRQAPEKEIIFFIILWFVGNVIYGFVNLIFKFQISLELRYFSGYIGYFILGYWLGNKEINFSKYLLLFIFLASWAVSAYVCYVISFQKGKYVYDFTDYLSPSVMLMTVSIFLLFKKAFDKEFLPKIMSELDISSFGIFLVHFLVLRFLSRNYQINYTFIHPLIGIFVHFFLCIIISFLIVKILSKIPKIGNWLVG